MTESTAPLPPIIYPVWYVPQYTCITAYPTVYPEFSLAYYPLVVPAPVVDNRRTAADSLASLSKNLSEAQAALATARKNYDAARSRAIYEQGGHIVAVRLEE